MIAEICTGFCPTTVLLLAQSLCHLKPASDHFMKLELQNIALQYNNKPSLFQNVNLSLDTGTFALIQGPSGSGKSSLLRLINRLQEPTNGTILIDNAPIDTYNITQLRRRIGYVQQTPVVIDDTVRNNLLLPFTFKTSSSLSQPTDDQLQQKLQDYLLKDVRLNDLAPELSVGQKQRLALIRTMLVNPEIILCDEPTSALDAESRRIVEHELEDICQMQQISVILVTHTDFKTQKVTAQTHTLTSNGLI